MVSVNMKRKHIIDRMNKTTLMATSGTKDSFLHMVVRFQGAYGERRAGSNLAKKGGLRKFVVLQRVSMQVEASHRGGSSSYEPTIYAM